MPTWQSGTQVAGFLGTTGFAIGRCIVLKLAQKTQRIGTRPIALQAQPFELTRVHFAHRATLNVGTRVDTGNVLSQRRQRLRLSQVGLGDEDAIGQRHLLLKLWLTSHLVWCVDGVDQRDHPIESVVRAQHGVARQCLNHGARVG